MGHGHLLSPDTQPGAGGTSPARYGTPEKLCLLHSSCCRWRLPLLSCFLPVLRARQGLGAGGRGAVGVWGGRLGAAAALPCSAHSSEQNSCLSCLSSPIFLFSNEEQPCFTSTQLIPECTATEPPPAALQPWAALTTGTHHTPTRDCGGPNVPKCIPVNPTSHKET